MSFRLSMFFVGALLASEANAAGSSTEVVRDLAGRVGPIIGSAQVCRDIERSRVQVIVDKFQSVIREASSQDTDRADLQRTAAECKHQTDCDEKPNDLVQRLRINAEGGRRH